MHDYIKKNISSNPFLVHLHLFTLFAMGSKDRLASILSIYIHMRLSIVARAERRCLFTCLFMVQILTD